jgi:DNA-directed RNA polymerase subunit H
LASEIEHELVPLHKILSDKEANDVLGELGINRDQLPKIFDTDPQAKKLGAVNGQMIRINREDNGKKYAYYRIVVKAYS